MVLGDAVGVGVAVVSDEDGVDDGSGVAVTVGDGVGVAVVGEGVDEMAGLLTGAELGCDRSGEGTAGRGWLPDWSRTRTALLAASRA